MRRKVLASFGDLEQRDCFDYSFSGLRFYYVDEDDEDIEIVLLNRDLLLGRVP
jgi:hypothetical protein